MRTKHIIKPLTPISDIGGKAKNLIVLDQMNLNVPQWVVIPQSVMLNQLPEELNDENAQLAFSDLVVPTDLLSEMEFYFGSNCNEKKYAVRSSAIDEDGQQFSFAGQYDTRLNVSFDQLENSIITVWKSVVSEHVIAYRKMNGLDSNYGIAVIIQEMIEPEVSGVAFGVDPVSGNRDAKVVSAVYGLGEGLVSGQLNADNYTITEHEIKRNIATKEFAFNCHHDGIQKQKIENNKKESDTLDDAQLIEIDELLEKLNDKLGSPQDIEFAYTDGKLFLLQTRPVTTLDDAESEYILWDNSNIVESYPGLTTPLTFSFISKMYTGVYQQLLGMLGVSSKVIHENNVVFSNTLGLVRGRVYYNLANWYKMLAMAPGYSINAKFMETMMGVKEKFELGEQYKMSKFRAWFQTVIMMVKMLFLQIRLPKQRENFQVLLASTLNKYNQIDFEACTANEIIDYYEQFETTLLSEWKAPLVNDFFSMIWFGLLKDLCEKSFPNEVNIHNDLLCGSQDIISVLPVRKTLALAKTINEDAQVKDLFMTHEADFIWDKLLENQFPVIKNAIDQYLDQFGERCIGELKLETISYNQNPVLFIQILKNYVVNNIAGNVGNSNIENELRSEADAKLNTYLKGKFFKGKWFKYVLEKARDLVSNRENLRFERTRAFGMVRMIFSALGIKLEENGQIENARDVFYLELDEVIALKNNESSLSSKINSRKSEFGAYQEQEVPEERFFTYGMNFTDEYIYSKEKVENITGDLKGIGCCPGMVKAKIRVVRDPSEISSLNGEILVTTSTDPGWVTLFPSASGIIVERGSLLSHSAIVSREMGIPCIVSVEGLLRTLKTGDEIIMDGRSGEIKILNK